MNTNSSDKNRVSNSKTINKTDYNDLNNKVENFKNVDKLCSKKINSEEVRKIYIYLFLLKSSLPL